MRACLRVSTMVYPKSWSMLRVAGAEAVRLWPFVVGFGVMNVAVCSLVAGLDGACARAPAAGSEGSSSTAPHVLGGQTMGPQPCHGRVASVARARRGAQRAARGRPFLSGALVTLAPLCAPTHTMWHAGAPRLAQGGSKAFGLPEVLRAHRGILQGQRGAASVGTRGAT